MQIIIKGYIIFLLLSASLAALSTGTVLGWLSQISQDLLDGQLNFSVTEDELGWVGSFMSLGAALFSLMVGSICDFLGRKNTMLCMVVVITIGWSQLIWASSVTMLYIGRFITGMVGGAYCAAVPLYTNEIAQKEIRGALGCFTQLMISMGILFTTIISKYLTIQQMTIVCSIIPFIFGAAFLFMPETPMHLVKKNKIEAARVALRRLRGVNYDVQHEIKQIEADLKEEETGNALEVFRESFKKSAVRKAFIIGTGLMLFKVFCGIDAITSYLSYILEETKMELDPQFGTIIFSAIQAASAIIQALVVDKLGRRILLLFSECTMAICLFIAALSLLIIQRNIISEEYYVYVNYLPLIALCVFTIAFSMGIGPIPWMMCAEIFPREIRSFMASFCTFLVWILAFLVVKGLVVVKGAYGLDVAFFIFAIASAIGGVFIWVIVPETKGKSLSDIQNELSGKLR